MLRSIQLENFKAFGQRTVIPLAPITLIFGQNSSGKSSILQSLNLLKQTRESRDAEALLQPRTENGFVDLGSFQEMLFDHDLRRKLSIRLEMALPKRRRNLADLHPAYPDQDSISLELEFTRPTPQEEVTLRKLALHQSELPVASFTPMQEDENLLPAVVPSDFRFSSSYYFRTERRKLSRTIQVMKCSEVADSAQFWTGTVQQARQGREKLVKGLQEARNALTGSRSRVTGDFFAVEGGEDWKRQTFKRLEDAIRLFSGEATDEQLIRWFREDQLGSILGLDGFLPIFVTVSGGEPSVGYILSRYSRRLGIPPDWFPNIPRLAVQAGANAESILSDLFPLGPFRKPAARLYIFTGTTPQDVGYEGHLLPDLLFRNTELVATANQWLERLEIGYELLIRPLGTESTDLFEVRLRDKRRASDVLVGLSDVGFGISQILPLVVQSLAGTNQIITIEQPEVHIHPRLQADLGDLLIETIKQPRRNQFIIETHSEHLALRLQRRVREKKLSPSDISVLYVSRRPDGAIVQQLRLDEEGDFMDGFPGGFFPERLRELR
jgi:hypothetical protein